MWQSKVHHRVAFISSSTSLGKILTTNIYIFFLIGNKDYIQKHYLMQKNIRQREKYKGKRKSVKIKKMKDTKNIGGS